MLRAILRTKERDPHSGAETERLETIDFRNDELEKILNSGGQCEDGYCFTELVGVETLPPTLADRLKSEGFEPPPRDDI